MLIIWAMGVIHFCGLSGKGFLGSEIIMDVKIQTEDGPNGGSVLADVVRATKVALNQGADWTYQRNLGLWV